ncbi:HlyD family secretion protein [Bartonella krasnovii]|uniref:HlyD family secretion protein n=1 Tax=Bartonella krasnovii TaxID=2267275 RepID=A0A5B9D2P8_9HYPH|nr:HlyD family secretion protein [Bartonella krasnovii]QEE12846.1 HlyD family secretion protein [Bartonella krasnovii]UNF28972.1 HlyD family secretion protein [Bartonella krasnovii]UNF35328.1 HlyD family secretion protein [Bartonella krasnovii]UNF42036.1 HlyD family secretion protein [Bartonella krasnovii]UNF46880.1 HlyD family secretion protein [Bartonella krasnovii]
MIKALRSKATIVAFLSGITGVLLILWAWRLPPFVSNIQITDNASIKGEVTLVSSQISGVIARIYVQDYQRVEKGMLLFELDDSLFRQQFARAQAVLDSKNAKLASIELQAQLLQGEINTAEVELARSRAFSNVVPDKKLGFGNMATAVSRPLSQLLAALETKRQLQKQLSLERQSLQSEVAGAKVGVELAKLNLDHTKILSPRTGYIGLVGARVGQYVMPGTQLVSVISDDIWIIANYKETQLSQMRVGQPVVFSVDALNNKKLTGRVVRFAPATGSEFSLLKTDTTIGNFIKIAQRISVRIALDPGQEGIEKLIPGMSVVTYVDTSQRVDSGG